MAAAAGSPALAEDRAIRTTKVVLAAAHLDHDPSHCGRQHSNVKSTLPALPSAAQSAGAPAADPAHAPQPSGGRLGICCRALTRPDGSMKLFGHRPGRRLGSFSFASCPAIQHAGMRDGWHSRPAHHPERTWPPMGSRRALTNTSAVQKGCAFVASRRWPGPRVHGERHPTVRETVGSWWSLVVSPLEERPSVLSGSRETASNRGKNASKAYRLPCSMAPVVSGLCPMRRLRGAPLGVCKAVRR